MSPQPLSHRAERAIRLYTGAAWAMLGLLALGSLTAVPAVADVLDEVPGIEMLVPAAVTLVAVALWGAALWYAWTAPDVILPRAWVVTGLLLGNFVAAFLYYWLAVHWRRHERLQLTRDRVREPRPSNAGMDSERTLSPMVWAAWLGVAWFAGVGLLWWGNRVGVHDPACRTYGTTCPGDFRFMLGWLTAEVLTLGAATRVWASLPAWRRARRVWQVVLALVVVAYPVTMHQGAVSTMHLRWLAALGAAAFVASRSMQHRPAAP